MKQPSYTRRTRVVLAVAIAVGALFVARLAYIQIFHASTYNNDSAGSMSSTTTLFGTRGSIVDSNGTVLAEAQMRYNVTASPVQAENSFTRTVNGQTVTVTPTQAAQEIAKYTKQDPNTVIGALNDALAANANSEYAVIAKSVDLSTYRALNRLNIPWLYFEQAPSRIYPNGAVAGNLVGFMGEDGTPLAGLELQQNKCLAGVNGEVVSDRSVNGGVVIPGSTVVTKPGKDGGTLKLTIDADLQWYVQQVLAKQGRAQHSRWGIAVVEEVKTGRLLAVADYPSVDPNNVNGTSAAYRGANSFTSPYEPGSIMKPLTAAMALDEGKANPFSPVKATYSVTYPNGANFHDDEHHISNLTLTGVLVESSNVGISKIGSRVSARDRYNYMMKFGMGSKTAVNFLGESGGIVYPWQNWDNQSYYTQMFGQGFTTTAIQMASAYQTLGNGGLRLPVSLIDSCTSSDGTVTKPAAGTAVQTVKPATARTVVNMMNNVANKAWYRKLIAIPGYEMATKTGTAQQSNGHGGYSSKYVVSLEGLIPAQNPQYVILVTFSNTDMNTTGADAPVFKAIANQLIKQYRIQPNRSNVVNYPLTY